MITAYENIFSKQPHYITIENALTRIKSGKSKVKVEHIRSTIDKERANALKSNLPSICFSGKFEQRKDDGLIEHSGFICLDFDDVGDIDEYKSLLCGNDYVYAAWVSPSGKGIKALVKIADGNKHREHFSALQDDFVGVDRSGINPSRVCYESYDPEIWINPNSKVFTKTKKTERIKTTERSDNAESFQNLLKWLSNKGDAFVTGERNTFIFKLASACCRFGLSEDSTRHNCIVEFNIGEGSFSHNELVKTIESAYRQNKHQYGTAVFEKERLIVTTTRSEVDINSDIMNPDIKPKDVIFGEDVKEHALDIYDNGYQKVVGIGVDLLDAMFKMKRGEITLLSGHGNMGKSTFLKWYIMMRIMVHDEKFALFTPEDNPAEEFYHDMVEIYCGMDCTPQNPLRVSKSTYDQVYDKISRSIFYVYPKDISPTPDYIKERFLELIIKEKIDGCIIDPFNQMSNDYSSANNRDDRYLATFLFDCSRFAIANNVYFVIVAHPKPMPKDKDGNYTCPDVYDISGGTMWNNKMDNILVYHRPENRTEINSTTCQLHVLKIRRQKIVGKKGMIEFAQNRSTRRFIFEGKDFLSNYIDSTKFEYAPQF